MINLEPVLKSLTENAVEFVIVGGVAITAHGSAYLTQDLIFVIRAVRRISKMSFPRLLLSSRSREIFPKTCRMFLMKELCKMERTLLYESEIGEVICSAKWQALEIMTQLIENRK